MMRVFGYGSLVNARTHDYTDLTVAEVSGWRRVWRVTTLRPLAFLSVEEAPGVSISGLIGTVPEADEAGLDTRETGYLRRKVSSAGNEVTMYQVDPAHFTSAEAPIPLSYLDVVVEGYLDHFGAAGVRAFADTTAGWHLPVKDDRAAPIYPRATRPGAEVTMLCDEMLREVGARVN